MPRGVTRYKTKRKRIEAQETFDYTTPNLNVTANPVDPYISATNKGNKLNEAVKALQSVNTTLTTYHTFQESQRKANSIKAKADHVKGSYNRSHDLFNLGVGYDETYNLIDGEARAIRLNTEYKQLMEQNNYFVDDENPETAREDLWKELYQKHFAGVNSEFAMAGAQEHIHTGKLAVDAEANAAQYVKISTDFLNNINTIQEDSIVSSGYNPEFIRKNADILYQQIKDKVNSDPVLKTYLPNRNTFTTTYINNIFNHAETLVNDDSIPFEDKEVKIERLLNVFDLSGKDGFIWNKVVDKNGNYLFKPLIETKINKLTHLLDLQEKAEIKKVTDEHKQTYVQLHRNLLKASSPEELAKVTDAIDMAINNNEIEPEDSVKLLNARKTKALNGNYIEENPKTVSTLWAAVYKGDIEEYQILNMVGSHINGDTANAMLNKLDTIKEKQDVFKSPEYKRFYSSLQGRFHNELSPGWREIQQNVLDTYFTLTTEGYSPRDAYYQTIQQFKEHLELEMNPVTKGFMSGGLTYSEFQKLNKLLGDNKQLTVNPKIEKPKEKKSSSEEGNNLPIA